ncbi:MAG: UMP kinase [Bifidobacteriaceae bacterium]|jgi:uridylate kinase|nr:UMP kinase [Bifidobacteriaceae bacterium]
MPKRALTQKNGKSQRRVLLKLSGEAFGGGSLGVDVEVLKNIAKQIHGAIEKGVEICIVVGGGNFFRGAQLEEAGIDRSRGDYMGMLGTVMNCLALQEFLEQIDVETRVQTAIAMGQIAEPYIPLKAIRHMQKQRVVIFGAGTGLPYFSTDTVAIQRALETHCEIVLMGKNGVDGVYSADPKTNPDAKKYEALTYTKAIIDDLGVMDAAALSLARENNMALQVFGIDQDEAVKKVLIGDSKIGTVLEEG